MRFGYDRLGRLTTVVNEAGQAYAFTLDAAGQVAVEQGFDGLTRQYVRDAAGRVTRTQQPGGRTSAYSTSVEQDLFNAAYKNDTAAIKTLIEKGSDVNQADDEHVTALYEAVRKGSYEAAELLLQNQADPDKHYNKDKYTVLHIAVANNNKRLTALLLRYTKNANSRDRFGNPPLWTAIHQASLNRNNDNAEVIEIVELLLQNGADPYSPNNIGEMQETRRIRDATERRWLVAQGWYTDGTHGTENQFRPWREYTVLPAIPSLPVPVPLPFPLPPLMMRTKPMPKQTVKIWENGVRYLTNEYQYVPLAIMLDFARRQGMVFASQSGPYAVPARLANLCAYFTSEAKRLDGQVADRPHGSRTRLPQVECRSLAERNKLRNQYLHRSARLPSEFKTGMAGRLDGGRDGHRRHVIADDVRHEKAQDAAVRQTKQKATQLKDAAADRYERFKRGAQHLYEQAKEEAKEDLQKAEKVLEETGKAMQSMPPPLLF
ncbi:MAG: hypothetical protein EOO62_02565 [Hymenobacter sp.]|nr:MAG: hypothetical protein EOO62_02565 [Hymenobacter sp.]